jgi:hypothetical protein
MEWDVVLNSVGDWTDRSAHVVHGANGDISRPRTSCCRARSAARRCRAATVPVTRVPGRASTALGRSASIGHDCTVLRIGTFTQFAWPVAGHLAGRVSDDGCSRSEHGPFPAASRPATSCAARRRTGRCPQQAAASLRPVTRASLTPPLITRLLRPLRYGGECLQSASRS